MADVWTGDRGSVETITIRNDGYEPYVITSIAIEPSSPISLATVPSLPHSLDGLDGLDIAIVFEPSSFGATEAELRIEEEGGTIKRLYIDAEGTWYPVRALADADGDFVKYESSIETLVAHRGRLLVNGQSDDSSRRLFLFDGTGFTRARCSGADLPPMGYSVQLDDDLIFQSGGAVYRFEDSISQVAAGYHDFDSATVSGSSVFFLDDTTAGTASKRLYVLTDGAVTQPLAATGSGYGGFAEYLSAGLPGTALVTSSGNAYICDGTEIRALSVADGCGYDRGLAGSASIDGELYFMGYDDASKRRLYRLSGERIDDAIAFESAGLSEATGFLGILDGWLYVAGRTASGAALAVRYDGTSVEPIDLSGASGLVSLSESNWEYAPIAWDGGIVARGYDNSNHLPLFIRNGAASWLDVARPGYPYSFKSPFAHGSLLYFAGYASDEAGNGRNQVLEASADEVRRLYAGTSGYSSGFSSACSIGDTLYFIGRDVYNVAQVYSFSYSE